MVVRILSDVDLNSPLTTPVYGWEQEWRSPTPSSSTIAATLGPRPGNTIRPPNNNYMLYKWAPKAERVEISQETLQDMAPEAHVIFFTNETEKGKDEPELIAGISLSELKKPQSPRKVLQLLEEEDAEEKLEGADGSLILGAARPKSPVRIVGGGRPGSPTGKASSRPISPSRSHHNHNQDVEME